MRKTYIEKLNKEVEREGLTSVSKKIGLSYSQLYRILHGISRGTIDSWEKIILYFKENVS